MIPPPYDSQGGVLWELYLLRIAREAEGSPSRRAQHMQALRDSRLFAGARLHLPADHSLNRWLAQGEAPYPAWQRQHRVNWVRVQRV